MARRNSIKYGSKELATPIWATSSFLFHRIQSLHLLVRAQSMEQGQAQPFQAIRAVHSTQIALPEFAG
jgi:hypothetical protein